MGIIKNLNVKQRIILIIAIIILFGTIIFHFIKQYNDNYIPKFLYRVYSEKNGWSKWCKNDDICGNKDSNIKKIEYKKTNSVYSSIVIYNGKEWIENNKNSNDIYALKLSTSKTNGKKYRYCYRSYNSKDKWLNWTCSDFNTFISGNKNEKIKQIQIKIIPKGVNEYDYLNDYYSNRNKSDYGF